MPPTKQKLRVAADQIDLVQLRKLSRLGHTPREIAWWFGIPESHLEKLLKLPEVEREYNLGRARLYRSLRQKQLMLASKGHAGMLIHLGKCVLGQVETSRTEHTGAGGTALAFDIDDTRKQVTGLITRIAARAGSQEAPKKPNG